MNKEIGNKQISKNYIVKTVNNEIFCYLKIIFVAELVFIDIHCGTKTRVEIMENLEDDSRKNRKGIQRTDKKNKKGI